MEKAPEAFPSDPAWRKRVSDRFNLVRHVTQRHDSRSMGIRAGVSWLSSSSAEIAGARDVLKSMISPGVIDELGFQRLQAPFAERFYPAVTTPMTRARYLIFIPAIYRHMETTGMAAGKDADRISRDLQFNLLEVLLKKEHTAIGKESGRNIIRAPSNIYWSALAALGIATQNVSEASYQRRLSAGEFQENALADDDGVTHPDTPESFWNGHIKLAHVMPGGAFPENTSFRLRRSEASFLRECYSRLRMADAESLMTHLINIGEQVGAPGIETFTYPWDVNPLPAHLEHAIKHACTLSIFARGATIHYHYMLANKRGDDASDIEQAFAAWRDQSVDSLREWDIGDFFAVVKQWHSTVDARDVAFIENWTRRCIHPASAQSALGDSIAQNIIATREQQMRPGRERLKVLSQLESWRREDPYPRFWFQLSYRHFVGRTIAQDIAEGLGGTIA